MKLQISLEMPEQGSAKPKLTPCEKAQKLIDKINSPNYDSETEWAVLKDTYKRLQALPKRCGEMKKLFELIHPVIDNYIDMDTKDGDMMEADSYMAYMSPEEDDDDEPSEEEDKENYK